MQPVCDGQPAGTWQSQNEPIFGSDGETKSYKEMNDPVYAAASTVLAQSQDPSSEPDPDLQLWPGPLSTAGGHSSSSLFPQLTLNFNPQMSYFHFLKAFVCTDLDVQLE